MRLLRQCIMAMFIAIIAIGLFSFQPENTVFAASKKPEKVVVQSAVGSDYNAVKITWKKAERAKMYQVYQATSKNGNYKLAGTTKNKNFVVKGLTTGKNYYFKVRAVNGSQKGLFSEKQSATPKLKKVKVLDTMVRKTSVNLTYKKVNGAEKYQVYRATSKSGKYKLAGTTSHLSFTDKKLAAGKKYYYKIRAVRKVNGKKRFGSYSDVKTVTTKKKSDALAPLVVKGKGNWYFFHPQGADGDSIADLQGKNLFSDEELSVLLSKLKAADKKCKSQGMEFVFFIAPNKESFYGNEYLPEKYRGKTDWTTADQVVEYIRENSNVKVVYAKDALTEVKKKYPEWGLFFDTDTHWNSLGAYVGTRALMEALGIQMEDVSEENVKLDENAEPGDLARMYQGSGSLSEGSAYYVENNSDVEILKKEQDFSTEFRYETTSANSQKLFMIRDSFCSFMSDYIAPNYKESVMLHTNYYNPKMIDKENPDVVVYEVVERYLGKVLNFTVE